ncbi:MAG TPA: histidine phosphatase family protein [Chloroflexota bacterium]|nr:histidine phosphatase family protein [Chloroflexota bacterium]
MSSTPGIPSPPVPTTLLIVRHAEVHNPADIVYGRLPRYRLSERGREQAAHTARFVAVRDVAAVYTSPLLRARQTADILSTYHPHAPVKVSRDLLETRTSYQGSPNSIIKPGFSFYDPKHDPADETMDDIWRRMSAFVRRVARRHAGRTVVAVSHADPITILRVGLEGRPFTTPSLHAVLYPARASVTQLVLLPDQPFSLTYFSPAGTSV